MQKPSLRNKKVTKKLLQPYILNEVGKLEYVKVYKSKLNVTKYKRKKETMRQKSADAKLNEKKVANDYYCSKIKKKHKSPLSSCLKNLHLVIKPL